MQKNNHTHTLLSEILRRYGIKELEKFLLTKEFIDLDGNTHLFCPNLINAVHQNDEQFVTIHYLTNEEFKIKAKTSDVIVQLNIKPSKK